MKRISTFMPLLVAVALGACTTGEGVTQSGQPSSPAVATPASSPSPSTSAIPYPLEGPLMPGGTYFIEEGLETPGRLTFTVPAPGWSANYVAIDKHHDEPNWVGLSTWIVTHVYADACQWQGTLVDAGETVDELTNALTDQRGRDVSAPTDVELGGFPAKRVEMTVEADLDVATCDMEVLRTWPGAGPDESQGLAAGPGVTDVVYVVDVDGKRLAVVAAHTAESSEQDRAELDDLVNSITIDHPKGGPSPTR